MGYYSDVRALVYGPTPKIDAMIAKHAMTSKINVFIDAWFKDNITVERCDDGTTIIDLRLESIKWHSDYDGCHAWHLFMDIATEEQFMDDVACEFVRIGENIDDNEHLCSGPINHWLNINRYISCEF